MNPVHIFDALILLYLALIPLMHRRGRRVRAEVAASRSWAAGPSTVLEAKHQQSWHGKGGTTYIPTVVYEYDANGPRHRGDRPYFGGPIGYSWKRNADRELASLVESARVQVFYDPQNPGESVIQRRAPVLRRMNVIFAMMFALLVVMVLARMYLAGLLDQRTG